MDASKRSRPLRVERLACLRAWELKGRIFEGQASSDESGEVDLLLEG